MALGSKTTFKSYIEPEKDDPLISFDDEDSAAQSAMALNGDTGAQNQDEKCRKYTLLGDEDINCDELTGQSCSSPIQTAPLDADSDIEEVQPVDMASISEINDGSRLCGYLNKYKIGARGLGRNFKKRWFVFNDSSCKLLYFRTPQDIVPLGEIDVSNASFNLEISHDSPHVSGREHVFEIRCQEKTVALEAPDTQTRMYWLKQLQSRRRRYSKRKTALLKEQQLNIKSIQEPCAGLIGKDRNFSSSGDQNAEWVLLDPGEIPQDSIGEASATKRASGSITDLSISNWKTEIRNALANLRGKRQSDIMEGSILASPMDDKSDVFPVEPVSPPSPTSPNGGSISPASPASKDNPFSYLKKRLSNSPRPRSLSVDEDEGPSDVYQKKYRQLQIVHANQKEELTTIEEELTAHRELITVLQRQIDILQRAKAAQQELQSCTEDSDKILLLEQRDKQIVELHHLLASIQEDRELVTARLREAESELNSIKDQINMYQTSVSAKDETIMSLTNKIFELECNAGEVSSQQSLTAINLAEMDKLRTTLDAFKIQNQFLNKEILELTQLREDDEAREKQLFIKATELEAKYYQIQSKYLLCLDQLRIPMRGGEENRSDEFVSQLLNDALDTSSSDGADNISSTSLRNSSVQYDQYGFSLLPQGRNADLAAHAQTLQRKSDELKIKDVDKEISTNVRWENFLVSAGSRPLQPCPELKNLIRLGVPTQHRERIWNSCIKFRVGKLREKCGTKYYHKLLEQLSKINRINPASKQIELDLLRTLPLNRHYETLHSEGIPKLRRILLAYTQHNPEIGYCQGLNRLAAIALLFLNEEDAFWCLVCLIEYIMPPEYYTKTLMAAQVDQRALKDVIQDKLPKLHSHLESHNVDLSLFTFNWFLTVFVDNIPVNTYLRIWDSFLYEGSKVLFRYAVAFFKYKEDEILEQKDAMSIHRYLRELGDGMTDIDRITQMAFHEINPFSMKNILAKRQIHLQHVKGELAELDAIRKDFQSSRQTRENYEMLSDDDM